MKHLSKEEIEQIIQSHKIDNKEEKVHIEFIKQKKIYVEYYSIESGFKRFFGFDNAIDAINKLMEELETINDLLFIDVYISIFEYEQLTVDSQILSAFPDMFGGMFIQDTIVRNSIPIVSGHSLEILSCGRKDLYEKYLECKKEYDEAELKAELNEQLKKHRNETS